MPLNRNFDVKKSIYLSTSAIFSPPFFCFHSHSQFGDCVQPMQSIANATHANTDIDMNFKTSAKYRKKEKERNSNAINDDSYLLKVNVTTDVL